MNLSISAIISLIALFVQLVLALFLLTVRNENRLSNRLLAAFLLVNALDVSGWFSRHYTELVPGLEMFRSKIAYLSSPLFCLYVLSVCHKQFRLMPAHLGFLLPWLLINLLLVPDFYAQDYQGKMLFFENYQQQPEIIFSHVFIHLSFAGFMFAALKVLINYRRLALEQFSTSTHGKWLLQLTVLSIAVHLIVVVKDILKFTAFDQLFYGLQLLAGVNVLIFLSWFVIKALHHPELFKGVDFDLQTSDNPANETELVAQEIQRLKEYMQTEEPYLNPELSIQQLAEKLRMEAKDLSHLINQKLGQHFYHFVNEYRIEKAKTILSDPEHNHKTVLEILYEVGFNSKSSFNTAFKKATGQTPTQYRKMLTMKAA